jgi:CheY-like chemotaxis protein
MPERAVVLLVEDSEDDILIMHKAFEKAGVLNPLYAVRDGEGAIAYLMGEGKYSVGDEYPLPALVLLDLKLPGLSGFEVLNWIRQTPSIRGLRVVILTSLDSVQDVNAAYNLGANCFMVKGPDFESTIEFVKLMRDYWLLLAKSPEISRPEIGTPVSESASTVQHEA